jgi:hypothetical protein
MQAMKLIDSYTGKMLCRFCGSIHFASLRPGGGYYRGAYVCGDERCKSNQRVWNAEKRRFVKLSPNELKNYLLG